MPFELDEVVLWGRNFAEYTRMFDLREEDFSAPILGCADGPASFNAEGASCGHSIISCDPIYAFSADQLRLRVETTYETVMAQVRANTDDFNWTTYRVPEDLGRARMECMCRFLDDFETGKREGRYVVASLPTLPFADGQFRLALSAHLLFTYSEHLNFEFHRLAIEELLRVADEVRLFPILTLDWRVSPHLEPLLARLKSLGYSPEIIDVPYDFLKAGNQMLRIRA